DVGGDDPGPVGGESQRGRPADAAARAGHHDELVPERFLRVAHGPFHVCLLRGERTRSPHYPRVAISGTLPALGGHPVRSARVTMIIDCPLMVPTAVQAAGHDTVNSSVSTVPGGTGVACSRQRVPSHVSANPPGGAKSLAASTPAAVQA